jgi:hypothetical protein
MRPPGPQVRVEAAEFEPTEERVLLIQRKPGAGHHWTGAVLPLRSHCRRRS